MTDTRADPITETVATYDLIAHRYAARFAVADRPQLREAFCSMLEDPAATVIDAGCGPGLGCRRLAAAGVTPIGLDLSKGMLAEARTITEAPLLRANFTRLPVPDRRVAGVWCDAALVHLNPKDVEVAMNEFARVVRAGGALFASVCIGHGGEWSEGPSGRRRWFHYHDGDWLLARIGEAGFATVATESKMDRGATWLSILAQRISPAPPIDGLPEDAATGKPVTR